MEAAIILPSIDLSSNIDDIIGDISFLPPSNPDSSAISVVIYESNSGANEPSQLLYEAVIPDFSMDEWLTYNPTTPIFVEQNKDYWVGFKIHTTTGRIANYDNNPVVEDLGAWIKDAGWFTLEDYTQISANWMINCQLFDHTGMNNHASYIPAPSKITIANYPNPFNPVTTITYNLPQSGATDISVFNIKGQKVATLLNKYQQIGNHTIEWNADAQQIASGIYFCKVSQKSKQTVTKLLLLK